MSEISEKELELIKVKEILYRVQKGLHPAKAMREYVQRYEALEARLARAEEVIKIAKKGFDGVYASEYKKWDADMKQALDAYEKERGV